MSLFRIITVLAVVLLAACVTRPANYQTENELRYVRDAEILPDDNHLSEDELREQVAKDVETELNFYGRVVDEEGNPIPDLPIQAAVFDHVLEPFESPYYGWTYLTDFVTDKNGEVKLETKGAAIFISVRKDGYWNEDGLSATFYYAERLQHMNVWPLPDHKKDPDELVLSYRPKEATPISVSTGAVRIDPNNWYDIALRGHPRYPAPEGHGDLQILLEKAETNVSSEPFHWRLTIKTAGGIQRNFDIDPLYAPESGYTNRISFDMSADSEKWDYRDRWNFFLQTPEGLYALIELRLFAGAEPYISIDGRLNPYGARIIN